MGVSYNKLIVCRLLSVLCFWFVYLSSGWAQDFTEKNCAVIRVFPEKTVSDTVPCLLYIYHPSLSESSVPIYELPLRIVLKCKQAPDHDPGVLNLNGEELACGLIPRAPQLQEGLEGLWYVYEYRGHAEKEGEIRLSFPDLTFQEIPYDVREVFSVAPFDGLKAKEKPASLDLNLFGSKLVIFLFLFGFIGIAKLLARVFYREVPEKDFIDMILRTHRLPLTRREFTRYYSNGIMMIGGYVWLMILVWGTPQHLNIVLWTLIPSGVLILSFWIPRSRLAFEKIQTTLSLEKLQQICAELAEVEHLTITRMDDACVQMHSNPIVNDVDIKVRITIVLDSRKIWVNVIREPGELAGRYTHFSVNVNKYIYALESAIEEREKDSSGELS